MIVLSKDEEKMEERESLLKQAEFNLELQGWGHIVETHVETDSQERSKWEDLRCSRYDLGNGIAG